MFKKIKQQLHKRFFPLQFNELVALRILTAVNIEDKKQLRQEIKDLKATPKALLSDIMKQSLGLITVDFVHQEHGVPNHYLNLPDTLDGKAKRSMYITQLATIQGLEVWPVLMENLINTQGNYTLRLGQTDMDVFAGRFQISGISLVRDEVLNGFNEWMEKVGPKEEFDPTDNSTEGIPYSADGQ